MSETKKNEEIRKDRASFFGVVREGLSENCLQGRSHDKTLQRDQNVQGPRVRKGWSRSAIKWGM